MIKLIKRCFKISRLLIIDTIFAEDINSHIPKNYQLNAQVGLQYKQGYGGISSGIFDGNKTNFQNLFADIGFEGIEFNHLAFGGSALGSINLNSNSSVYKENISSNAVLYELFVGFRSEYFDISIGRETIDLEWLNDFLEGARAFAKIPQLNTQLSAYYFYRKAVASIDEISNFTDNKLGHSVVLGISNNSLKNLMLETYFMDISIFNAVWAKGILNFDLQNISSNTTLKYTFFNNKSGTEYADINYLQLEQNLTFSENFGDITLTIGGIKVFSKDTPNTLEINKIGDQNPLEQGDQFYFNNTLSIYAGMEYNFKEWFNASLIYGNTSMARIEDSTALSPINEIDLSFGANFKGISIELLYSKLFGKNLPSNPKISLNRDYVQTIIAYNF